MINLFKTVFNLVGYAFKVCWDLIVPQRTDLPKHLSGAERLHPQMERELPFGIEESDPTANLSLTSEERAAISADHQTGTLAASGGNSSLESAVLGEAEAASLLDLEPGPQDLINSPSVDTFLSCKSNGSNYHSNVSGLELNPQQHSGITSFEPLGFVSPDSECNNGAGDFEHKRKNTMASQGGGQRVVHQDYIVRQRYSNTLPPPPGAPKLLDLPNDGLNQYTMPLFASRMARAQPINIEADAFLGMPIDLVGMPGVFEGDESSIQAPLVQPPVDPKDRNLLRPLKSLGKPKGEDGEISFLRRTQYTAEDRSRVDAAKVSVTPNLKRRRVDGSKEDPVHILRDAIKSFDIANPESVYKGPDTASQIRGHAPNGAELEAWNNPKHPTKPHLQPIDFYPVLPGMEAFPDDGMYTLVQFKGHPTEVMKEYDQRMDAALLYPDTENHQELSEELQAKLAAHKADPVHVRAPMLPMPFQFFLPEDATSAVNFRRKFDPKDPDHDDSALYTSKQDPDADEADCFHYKYVREYETGHLVDSRDDPYQEVAMVLHDGDAAGGIQKGAYYYPVAAKFQLKPRRNVNIGSMGPSQQEEPKEKIDVLHVKVRAPNDDEIDMREAAKKKLEPDPDRDGEA